MKSCPQGLIQDLLIDILPGFMSRRPRVRVQLKVSNRRADLVEDGVNIAVRARASLDADPNLIVRALGKSTLVLVATSCGSYRPTGAETQFRSSGHPETSTERPPVLAAQSD